MIRRLARLVNHLCYEWGAGLVAALPNDTLSCRLRSWFHRRTGCRLGERVLLYRNVLILGQVQIGARSSISNNCVLSGAEAGITLGADVMMAPGCCAVAFDHGNAIGAGPMIRQPIVQAPITVGDDVWIGANCTIVKGVTIGSGAIIGANSVVTTDIPPLAIAAGVPARVLKYRT